MIFEEKFFPIEVTNVGVDSSYRDKEKYPNPSEYTMNFETIFKNVVTVQLVFAVYERTGIDPYVNLWIDEMSPNLVSNSNHVSGSFCQLPLTASLNVYNSSMYKCSKTFEKPLAKLSKLTIRFLKGDGTPYPMKEHFLKFEVSCLKFSGKTKEWTNNEMFAPSISMYEPSLTPASKIFNLPVTYDLDLLKTAFKSACDRLRAQQLPNATFIIKYEELKGEFKRLAGSLRPV